LQFLKRLSYPEKDKSVYIQFVKTIFYICYLVPVQKVSFVALRLQTVVSEQKHFLQKFM